ncbi:hypothetical protein N7501_010141 [Penicillium viridicatum]|nr:hypothetical protein N7501_010141 [Penicillium viridicatum]
MFYGSGPESPSLAFVCSNSIAGNALDILDWTTLVARGWSARQASQSPRVDEVKRNSSRFLDDLGCVLARADQTIRRSSYHGSKIPAHRITNDFLIVVSGEPD